tara:strand:- start:435 stop:566 length:132 start_codon:yes stop_codon:yes gene_type:complete
MSLQEGERLGDSREIIYVFIDLPRSFIDAYYMIPNVFKNNFIY